MLENRDGPNGSSHRIIRYPPTGCYVGEPVAMVVAETYIQARDAAERIEVDYSPLNPSSIPMSHHRIPRP